jgi:hypothetical protein
LTRLAVQIASVETLTDLAGVASRVADVGAAAQLLVKVVIGGVAAAGVEDACSRGSRRAETSVERWTAGAVSFAKWGVHRGGSRRDRDSTRPRLYRTGTREQLFAGSLRGRGRARARTSEVAVSIPPSRAAVPQLLRNIEVSCAEVKPASIGPKMSSPTARVPAVLPSVGHWTVVKATRTLNPHRDHEPRPHKERRRRAVRSISVYNLILRSLYALDDVLIPEFTPTEPTMRRDVLITYC